MIESSLLGSLAQSFVISVTETQTEHGFHAHILISLYEGLEMTVMHMDPLVHVVQANHEL